MDLPPLTEPEFWAKVDMRGAEECWPWTRAIQSQGYGVIGRKKPQRQTFYAHRLAYEFATGHEPANLVVRHSCDNPPCCNPAHLVIGTFGDNSRDMIERGRHYSPFTREERARHGFQPGGPCKP